MQKMSFFSIYALPQELGLNKRLSVTVESPILGKRFYRNTRFWLMSTAIKKENWVLFAHRIPHIILHKKIYGHSVVR